MAEPGARCALRHRLFRLRAGQVTARMRLTSPGRCALQLDVAQGLYRCRSRPLTAPVSAQNPAH